MADHVEVQIGVGRYEAFTIVGNEVTSSQHSSVAAALVWLLRRFMAVSVTSESDVPAAPRRSAIGDVDGQVRGAVTRQQASLVAGAGNHALPVNWVTRCRLTPSSAPSSAAPSICRPSLTVMRAGLLA